MHKIIADLSVKFRRAEKRAIMAGRYSDMIAATSPNAAQGALKRSRKALKEMADLARAIDALRQIEAQPQTKIFG
jgi:hypothetical protein